MKFKNPLPLLKSKLKPMHNKLAHLCPILFGQPVQGKPISPFIVYGSVGATIGIIILISLPRILDESALKKLGYSNQAIAQINALDLVDEIKDNYLFSETMNTVFENQLTVDPLYLPLYTIKDVLDDETILFYKRLIVKGYNQDDILNILNNLKNYEISVLLTFQKLDNVQEYIDDCLSHPENSIQSFTLSKQYATPYQEGTSIPSDASNVNMLVNKFNYLDASYTPNGLNELSVRYGANGVALAQEAASALAAMVDKFQTLGYSTGFYVSSGYRDYASQEEVYNSYVAQNGQEKADALATRAGYSEHQTGLSLDLASTDYGKEFKDTEEFNWVIKNCADYGFILRFPEEKEYITHISYEPWHYRYVGVDIAKAVNDSGYTYDEYYEIYLRPLPENINDLILENQKDGIDSNKFSIEHKVETTIDPLTSAETTIEPTLPSEA